MDTSTTESLLPRTNSAASEEKKPGRKSVRIDETVDIITANSPCVLESTPLNIREETATSGEAQPEKRSQEHEYQDNHHQTTNLQYHQHNHLYEQQNNNNNQEDPYLHEQQQQQQQQLQQYHHHQELQEHYEHNNNNNNNYSHHQQQQHHLPPSPPPPPPAKNKELRVTFSDSPLCDSRYGEPPNRVTKSASSNCDVDINNLNAAFIRRPIKRSQRIRPKNISFNLDNEVCTERGGSPPPSHNNSALDHNAPLSPIPHVEAPNTQNGLESRDNPFVPGGELAIDTEDILKRATIVRDKFILEEQEKQKIENEALAQAQTQDKTDGPTGKAVGKSPDTKGTGKDVPKENGKVDEEKAGEQATRPPTGGQTGELQDGPKDKKKQKKKCCTIM